MTIIPSGVYALSQRRCDTRPYLYRPHSSHVLFSPNSKYVLASTQDSTIRLWNYQTSRCVKTYTGHTNGTYSLVAGFSTTGGQYIVSGSEDARIYIWDLQSRRLVQTLEGHKGGYTVYPVLNGLNLAQMSF
jgi:WD40 repeat protein